MEIVILILDWAGRMLGSLNPFSWLKRTKQSPDWESSKLIVRICFVVGLFLYLVVVASLLGFAYKWVFT
jgi:hypothetical protein